jgi:hypothetical protein
MNAKRYVLRVLTKDLPTPFEKSFASRLFAINKLCHEVEQEGLTLDRIRSQGSLFALAVLVKRANETGVVISLTDAVEDASTLTIADLRKKWRHVLQTGPPPAAPPELQKVLKWIAQARDRNALRQIAAATYQRLAVCANSQQNTHAQPALRFP